MSKIRTSSPPSAASGTRSKRSEELFSNRVSEQPPPVLDKKDFVRRYKTGEFGNASPTWSNLEELLKTPHWRSYGPFHIRNRIAQGKSWYDQSADMMELSWEIASRRIEVGGAHNLYISSMAPHWHNLIQGEVTQTPWDYNYVDHLFLRYSDLPDLPMRDAFEREQKYISGLGALSLLKSTLCPNSWDWLNQLLDNYPGHIIEFSTFSVDWGTVPGFNTVFWEIRAY